MTRRTRGRDEFGRNPKPNRGRGSRKRTVHVFAEGEVTEEQYIYLLRDTVVAPAEKVDVTVVNTNAKTRDRKPLTLVEAAIPALRKLEQDAARAGLEKQQHWNWPQVWVFFDRDKHDHVVTAYQRARKNGIRVAYSHPCFELWRLLHYRNYTSTFGGVCGDASSRLRSQNGFARTYDAKVKSVSEQGAKHVKGPQILSAEGGPDRFQRAKGWAEKLNGRHTGGDPDIWDPYTDVYRFVEEGLDVSSY